MPPKNLWTKEKLILAFNFSLKIPFGKMHSTYEAIILLENLVRVEVDFVKK